MDDSVGVIYRLEAEGVEMTYREAVEVNTRLQQGRPVPREERQALACGSHGRRARLDC
jgi:hypothetical protein